MNAYEQLLVIRDRLENQGAHEDSIAMVDKLVKRAEPDRDSPLNVPLVQMVRHMLRQREVLDNYAIYNDLQELMGDYEDGPREECVAIEEEEHRPRPHSYYREQKNKERGKK